MKRRIERVPIAAQRCRMRIAGRSLLLACLLSALSGGALRAQDALPPPAPPALHTPDNDTLHTYRIRMERVREPHFSFPAVFQNTSDNALTDSLGVLDPFWEKLRQLRLGYRRDTIYVVHIGDSHVRGHLFPRTAGGLLSQAFGNVVYTDMGVNGATCLTFTHPGRIKEIAALHPDLLILSFGTNESHNRRYNATVHYRQMEELLQLLRARLPDVPMLMTTPPGSFDRFGTRRRRTYKVNPRTAVATRTICRFARAYRLAVWNLYAIAGDSARAPLNWQDAKLMRPDHVHYLPEAYTLQGELLGEALLKGYNEYVGYE
ncbi:MAG: SGNH/GDSL hydrolase family protein [Prevotellaceae bacterium]|jgi:lysophospholipase L1-like esterase|nr:SGNH/GDSL hydrolase family protein [Prevotellaceae bacterium]